MKNRLGIFTISALTAVASTAHAHPGTEVGGGFLHPVAGVDHLVALVASAPVGLHDGYGSLRVSGWEVKRGRPPSSLASSGICRLHGVAC